MKKQRFLKFSVIVGLVGATCVILSAQTRRTATPGTVNYIEGEVSIDGQAVARNQNGYSELESNQVLSTQNGKAEILLSPGVFLRVGNNSEIRMVSPQLVAPQVEVTRGEAMVEADWVPKDAQINVLERGAQASIRKAGLYRFDSDASRIEVIDGKLQVTENDQTKEFGKGKEVMLTAAQLKPVSFDRKAEDDLYRWSSVRASYLAEANMSTAQSAYAGYGPYWGAGWYWNPYFAFWSWLPGDGYFFSPFGYPFFSPAYVVYAPGFWRGGFGYRGGFPARGFAAGGGVALAPRAGGFAGGGGGFHGGGGRR
jgi:FecR protein